MPSVLNANCGILKAQLFQIRVTLLNAFERHHGLVVLNKIMLNSGKVGFCEDRLPINHTAANFSHHAVLIEVLHVHQWKTARVFLEVGERITFASCAHPKSISIFSSLGSDSVSKIS